MSALDVLIDRKGARIGFCLKALVVLSFLVSELGHDFGCTWPLDTRSSVPETNLSVGTVHVASSAFQTSVVTNE